MNSPTVSSIWLRRLTGPLAAAVILAAFWLFMLASLREKSLTSDEIVHVTAGYTYWRFDDYRLNPENGNLPQRLMALPLLGSDFRFPSLDSAAWHRSDEWAMGDQWFHRMGNDVASMLARGRAASGLMAVALGALVWGWSRRLFGPLGGMLSLGLFVLSPSILANGALMTSDTACALFFLAATWGWWSVLQRLSAGRILLSSLAMGGLFVSKMSAVLIVPIALTLVIARLIEGRPLPVAIGAPRELARRGRQALAFAAAGLAHAAVVVLVIWASFGFRYSVFAEAQPGRDRLYDTWEHLTDLPLLPNVLADLRLSPAQHAEVMRLIVANAIPVNKWTPEALDFMPVIKRTVLTPEQGLQLDREMSAPPAKPLPRLLEWINRRHLLPEGYVFGQVFSLKFTQKRGSFLNGHFGVFGWWWFFPYTVLVKTPLPVFGVILLAFAAAAFKARLRSLDASSGTFGREILRSFYETLPLWTLLAFYWGLLIPSHINIGHRHILATYPPLFVLCGAAAVWLRPARLRSLDASSGAAVFGAGFAAPKTGVLRAMRVVLLSLLVLLAAEVFYRFPDYLAYFNVIAGGPANGYRHLVDSSLDWGQDLPGVKRYVDDHHLTGRVYLSYFGSASPEYYHTPAQLLYSLSKPTQLITAPAGQAESEVAETLKSHPEFDVAASGEKGGQEAVMFLEKPAAFRLQGGTYFISATMLQPLEYEATGPWGPWNDRYEAKYQELHALAQPFLGDDQAARIAALQQGSAYDWIKALNEFDEYRFARLTAYLRNREPDDSVGYSILIYRLTDADLSRAVDGPSPEHGPDVLRLLEAKTQAGVK